MFDQLVRRAVNEQIALWKTIKEIENRLGHDLDGIEDTIAGLAVSVNSGEDIGTVTLKEIRKEWEDSDGP